jgi:hypothetical protein
MARESTDVDALDRRLLVVDDDAVDVAAEDDADRRLVLCLRRLAEVDHPAVDVTWQGGGDIATGQRRFRLPASCSSRAHPGRCAGAWQSSPSCASPSRFASCPSRPGGAWRSRPGASHSSRSRVAWIEKGSLSQDERPFDKSTGRREDARDAGPLRLQVLELLLGPGPVRLETLALAVRLQGRREVSPVVSPMSPRGG